MYLTRELRREFNEMTDSLNRGVEEAVTDFDDDHIQFVDIETSLNGDDLLAGHRFCEKGVSIFQVINPKLSVRSYSRHSQGQTDSRTRFKQQRALVLALPLQL